jgi:regulator of sigma E protease
VVGREVAVSLIITIIAFFAILGVLVLAHELGHFLTARASGVRVEEFGLGYPPRLYSIKKGEIVYSINLLPLGGFTKMAGEEDPVTPGYGCLCSAPGQLSTPFSRFFSSRPR